MAELKKYVIRTYVLTGTIDIQGAKAPRHSLCEDDMNKFYELGYDAILTAYVDTGNHIQGTVLYTLRDGILPVGNDLPDSMAEDV
jgi:hypothetical protein